MSTIQSWIEDLVGGDEVRAEHAASQLGLLGSPAISGLEELLKSSEADHRWWAIRTLAYMPDIHVNYFVDALEDVSSEVRQAAALALAGHPVEAAAPALVRALGDEDAMLQTLAVNALSAIGKPVVPILMERFPRASASEKIHSMRVLAEVRDPRAIPVMMKALEEDSAILHHWCEIGLEQLGLDMVYLKLD